MSAPGAGKETTQTLAGHPSPFNCCPLVSAWPCSCCSGVPAEGNGAPFPQERGSRVEHVVGRTNEGVEEEVWVWRPGWSRGFVPLALPCLPRKQPLV